MKICSIVCHFFIIVPWSFSRVFKEVFKSSWGMFMSLGALRDLNLPILNLRITHETPRSIQISPSLKRLELMYFRSLFIPNRRNLYIVCKCQKAFCRRYWWLQISSSASSQTTHVSQSRCIKSIYLTLTIILYKFQRYGGFR